MYTPRRRIRADTRRKKRFRTVHDPILRKENVNEQFCHVYVLSRGHGAGYYASVHEFVC
jgi:hypothetical protein